MSSPVSTSAAPTRAGRPRKQRGIWFWLKVALCVVLAAPLVAYLGTVLYFQLGFATAGLVEKLSRTFDTRAEVGSVSTHWLRDFSVDNISIKAADKSEPIKLGSVKMEYDAGPLLRENRVRQITIDQPKFDLRRDDAGKWNFNLKTSEKNANSYRIEQTIFREGEVSVQWASPGAAPKHLKLLAFSGNVTDPGPLAPSAFSLYGVFESLENISMNGTAGPGAAWNARVFGGVNLERDLAGILGETKSGGGKALGGHVTFDLMGRRESLLLNAARGGPITISGQLGLERLRIPLNANWSMGVANRKLDVIGTLETEGVPDAWAAVNNLQLRLDGLGLLKGSGRILKPPGLHAALEQVNGHLDLEALNALFEPRLMPPTVSAKGNLEFSDVAAIFPLGEGAPPQSFSARIAANGARISVSTLGELPACDISGKLKWPALSDASLSLGELCKISLDLRDLNPSGENFWLTLASGAKIHAVSIDVGRFWESEIGRRLLTTTFDLKVPVPPVSAMPYIFSGQLSGNDLSLAISPNAAKPERLALNGLRLTNSSIEKWPLPFRIPAKKFSGELNLRADMADGVVKAVALNAAIGDSLGAARVEFEQTYFPTAEPAQRVGPVKIKQAVCSFEDLDQIFDIKKLAGVSGTGAVHVEDAAWNLTRKDGEGTIALEACNLAIELPPSAQAAMVSVLKMSDHALIASALESFPVETLKLAGLNAVFTARLEQNRLSLKGRTEELPLKIKSPAGVPLAGLFGSGDYTVYTLPAADVALETELDEKGAARFYRVDLAWQKLNKVSLVLKPPLDEAARGFWQISGSIQSAAAGGVTIAFSAPYHPQKRMVGDVKLSVEDLDLALLAPRLAAYGVQALSGRMKDVELNVKPFLISAVSAGKFPDADVNGGLDGVAFSDAFAEFANLDGKLRCVLTTIGESFSINALLKLDKYEALLNNGAFYIPPPAPGHGGDLHLVGSYTRNDKGGQIVLNNCEMNVGDDVQIAVGGTFSLIGTALARVDLNPLRVILPDMARAVQTFGKVNLDNRAPWFGDVGLSGRGNFEGSLEWDAKGTAALGGKIGFHASTISLGKVTPFVLSGVTGEFPLALRWDAGAGVRGQVDPGVKPFEVRGKLNLGPLNFGALAARKQELSFVASPNRLLLDSPVEIHTPVGDAIISSAAYKNLLSYSKDAQPEIEFTLATKIDLGAKLKEFGVPINGLESSLLAGAPLKCVIRKTDGLRGPWELLTDGSLRGPFYGAEAVVEKLNARGLFGPAPTFGGEIHFRGSEGLKITQFTEKNQQLGEKLSGIPGKNLGKFSLRANCDVTGIEAVGVSLEELTKFTLNVESVDFKDNEFWYDGEFAMTMNYPLVRAAFPTFLYRNDDSIRPLKFGVKKIALKYELRDGVLTGPTPTILPDNLILQAYGTEKGVKALFADFLKQDLKADTSRTPWPALVRQVKGGK